MIEGLQRDVQAWAVFSAPWVFWMALLLLLLLIWHLSTTPSEGKRTASARDLEVSPPPAEVARAPQGKKIEIAMRPGSGLQWSNPSEVFKFETDLCTGSYVFFHPPTDPAAHRGFGSLDYASYFKGKTRLWEMRIQLQLKRSLPQDWEGLYFGIELDGYVDLSAALRRTIALSVAGIRKAIGSVYQSPGDDPDKVAGELEKPCCVLPLWAFDQFIETAAGETPPDMSSPDFSQLGRSRKGRVAEYAREIDDLTTRMAPGATYTFAFWGVSRFVDAVNWKLRGIPVVTPLDFNKLIGQPPVYAVLYALQSANVCSSSSSAEQRHLASRKSYLFRAACWSSEHRPTHLRELLGAAPHYEEGREQEGMSLRKKASFRKRLGRMFKDPFACCVTRSSEVIPDVIHSSKSAVQSN